MAWYIKYGLGGGFGGCDNMEWERTDANSVGEAENWARESAKEEYLGYGGMHGLFNEEEYREDNPDATDEDVYAEEENDMDSWLDYMVEWFDEDPNE